MIFSPTIANAHHLEHATGHTERIGIGVVYVDIASMIYILLRNT